jgi:hypothetical protein
MPDDVILATTAGPALGSSQPGCPTSARYRATDADLSALGVAHLAGRSAGMWTDQDVEQLSRPASASSRITQPNGERSDRQNGMRPSADPAVSRLRGVIVIETKDRFELARPPR